MIASDREKSHDAGPRVLLTGPPIDEPGGVANYCRLLLAHLPATDYLQVGSRAGGDPAAGGGPAAGGSPAAGGAGGGHWPRVAVRLMRDYWRFWRALSGERYDGERYDGERYDGGRYDGGRYDGGRYDVVHLNPSLNAKAVLRDAVFLLMAKALRRKVVVLIHGWDRGFERTVRRHFLRPFGWVFFRADALIVLAESFGRSLREMGCRKPIYTDTTAVADEVFGGTVADPDPIVAGGQHE